MKLALAFPGQGAQKVGLGEDLWEEKIYRETFEEASQLLGYDLKEVCFGEKIHDTHYTQVALFTASLATLRLLKLPLEKISLGFGLSLGEYTAVCGSGKISFATFLPLIQKRGTFMAEVAKNHPGKMVAVLNTPLEEIEKACEKARSFGIVAPCNFNTLQQTVLGGDLSAVDAAVTLLKEAGFKKLIPLKVSGAFHSGLFKAVTQNMEKELAKVTFTTGHFPILSNVTGKIHQEATFSQTLAAQISQPVQMVKMCETLKKEGITQVLEIGCGNVVSGLVKKNQKEIATFAIDNQRSLEKFLSQEVSYGLSR